MAFLWIFKSQRHSHSIHPLQRQCQTQMSLPTNAREERAGPLPHGVTFCHFPGVMLQPNIQRYGLVCFPIHNLASILPATQTPSTRQPSPSSLVLLGGNCLLPGHCYVLNKHGLLFEVNLKHVHQLTIALLLLNQIFPFSICPCGFFALVLLNQAIYPAVSTQKPYRSLSSTSVYFQIIWNIKISFQTDKIYFP